MSRDERKSFSSSQETIGNFLKEHLERSGLQQFQGYGEPQVSLHFFSFSSCIYLYLYFNITNLINHLICFSNKHCNGLPRLNEDELERFGEVSSSIEEKEVFLVPDLLESKSFRRSFSLPKPMASGKAGENRPRDDAPPIRRRR